MSKIETDVTSNDNFYGDWEIKPTIDISDGSNRFFGTNHIDAARISLVQVSGQGEKSRLVLTRFLAVLATFDGNQNPELFVETFFSLASVMGAENLALSDGEELSALKLLGYDSFEGMSKDEEEKVRAKLSTPLSNRKSTVMFDLRGIKDFESLIYGISDNLRSPLYSINESSTVKLFDKNDPIGQQNPATIAFSQALEFMALDFLAVITEKNQPFAKSLATALLEMGRREETITRALDLSETVRMTKTEKIRRMRDGENSITETVDVVQKGVFDTVAAATEHYNHYNHPRTGRIRAPKVAILPVLGKDGKKSE